jgi:hypothetical protein
MDSYLRAVREKISELSTIGLKLESWPLSQSLPERYRYLVVSLEKQERIDFDELAGRLLEEEKQADPGAKIGGSASRLGRLKGTALLDGKLPQIRLFDHDL